MPEVLVSVSKSLGLKQPPVNVLGVKAAPFFMVSD